MIHGVRIGYFHAAPGLTREQTLMRELIRHALVFCHVHDNKGHPIPGSSSIKGAARYLGINRGTLHRRLLLYTRLGVPIAVSTRHATGGVRLTKLLVVFDACKPEGLWKGSSWDQRDFLAGVNRIRLTMLKDSHPDKGGSAARTVEINEAWRRIKRIFKRHGIEL